MPPQAHYLRLERFLCVRSDAAARLAIPEAVFDRSVLPAADAAFFPVTFVLPTCARSDAAARLAVLDALFDRSVLPAADAAFFPVRPDRASPSLLLGAGIASHLCPTDRRTPRSGRQLGASDDVGRVLPSFAQGEVPTTGSPIHRRHTLRRPARPGDPDRQGAAGARNRTEEPSRIGPGSAQRHFTW